MSRDVVAEARQLIDNDEPATVLTLILNEACFVANKKRFQVRKENTSEEAVQEGIKAAYEELKRLENELFPDKLDLLFKKELS